MEPQNDIAALIQGCINSNRKAQEALYKNYYAAMMNICQRYTKTEEDAVEVLNNGFLKVFRNIGQYDPAKSGLYTWMRAIVVHSCIDFVRSRQGTVQAVVWTEEHEVPVDAEVLQKLKAADLLQLMRQLPPATQAVINLYVVEGYNHREISQLLQISEGTSKWHLSEGRKNLQRMIQKQNVPQHG